MEALEQASYFRLSSGVIFYTHNECSIDPEWDTPSWVEVGLIATKDTPQSAYCHVCLRLLTAEPPYQWSKMSTREEVLHTMAIRSVRF